MTTKAGMVNSVKDLVNGRTFFEVIIVTAVNTHHYSGVYDEFNHKRTRIMINQIQIVDQPKSRTIDVFDRKYQNAGIGQLSKEWEGKSGHNKLFKFTYARNEDKKLIGPYELYFGVLMRGYNRRINEGCVNRLFTTKEAAEKFILDCASNPYFTEKEQQELRNYKTQRIN